MFQNIYPVFEPKRLLKKEMLENLRDFPRSLFGLQYQNYSDGILYGCDITGTETGMILLPGILCYKGVPYFLERPYPVTCKAEGKMAYVKVHFWDKTIGSGGEEYEPGIYLRVGLMDTEEDADWDLLPYVLHRNAAPRETKKGLKGQICYQIETYDILPLGEKVLFKGKELYIGKIERFFRQGLFVSRYYLYFAEGLRKLKYYNPFLGGVSINGVVTAASRNRLQAQLETDALANYRKKYFFPFSTVAASPDGSGWYCMPRPGDQVRIFFPTADEKESYAIANIQGDSSPASDSPMSRPDLKDITMPDGKAVRFIEGGIQLAVGGNKGTVTLTNDGNAEIVTDDDIEISAAEAVCFSTDGMMSVTAGSRIQFINDAGGNITVTDETVKIDAAMIINN